MSITGSTESFLNWSVMTVINYLISNKCVVTHLTAIKQPRLTESLNACKYTAIHLKDCKFLY